MLPRRRDYIITLTNIFARVLSTSFKGLIGTCLPAWAYLVVVEPFYLESKRFIYINNALSETSGSG
nr:MAG TPA: hypothetical protein [Caudoviricetes sp.]